MQRFSDDVINQAGRPQAGVAVTVTTTNATCGTGALASLFSDDGITATGNPIFTDALGRYGFYVPTGKYDLTYSGGSITTYCRSAVEIGDFLEFKSGDLAPTSTGNWLATGNWTFSGSNVHSGTESFTAATTFSSSTAFSGTTSFAGPGNTGSLGLGLTALSANNSFTGNNTFSGTTAFTGSGNTGTLSLGTTALTANNAFTGNNTHTGAELFKSLNSIQFCDQFAGSDASAKIQACINALPAAGGVADARNLSDSGGTGSTVIDPGTAAVTLLLGPYTYQIQQIKLRPNFRIIGAGMGNALGTILQACSTCGSTNTIVYGGTVAIQGVLLEGFRLLATSGNTTQIGIQLVAPSSNTGLWYSTFRNICVGICAGGNTGFLGGTIVLDAGTAGVHQFDDFRNVQGFRGTTGNALLLNGTVGQLYFDQCQFDGTAANDGGTNIALLSSATTSGPYSVTFNNVTSQKASVATSIAGAQDITFINTHNEQVGGAFLLNVGLNASAGTSNIVIQNGVCANFCGQNSSNGYFAKNSSPANVTAKFINNQFQGTLDNILVGFTTAANYIEIGDELTAVLGASPYTFRNTIPLLIANSTAAMTTASIGSLACGTTVTVAATGVLTTDAISWAFNAAPAANPGELVVSAWPTANNVNFQYCNPTAGSVTPNAATLNWKVVR